MTTRAAAAAPAVAQPAAPVTLHGARVRLRPWRPADRAPFAALNADAEVMRHFAAPLSTAESDAMAERIGALFRQRGWGLWALETDDIGFAGFVGLSWVPFSLPVPGFGGPQLEIGWRLARAAWGRGLASEAAQLALQFAQQLLLSPARTAADAPPTLTAEPVQASPAGAGAGISPPAPALAAAGTPDGPSAVTRVVSFTTLGNARSMAVMRRIGLLRVADFDHPRLAGHALQRHVLYATPARGAGAGAPAPAQAQAQAGAAAGTARPDPLANGQN